MSLKIKSVIIILMMSVILCSVAVFTVAVNFSSTNENTFKERAKDIAYTVAVNIDGGLVEKVTDMVLNQYRSFADDEIVTSDDWGSPEFETFTGKFAWIMDTPEYKLVTDYLYNIVNKADIDTLSAIYIIAYDASRSEPYSLYITVAAKEPVCYPGVIDRFESFEVLDAVYNPDGGFEPYTGYYDEYGWLVVAGAPIYNSSGEYTAFMCVDLLMDEVKAHEYNFIINLTIMLVIVTFVLGALYLIIIIKSIVSPINKLSLIASDYIRDSEKKPRSIPST